MINLRRRTGLVAGATALALTAAPSAASASSPRPGQLQQALDSIVAAGASGVTAEIDSDHDHVHASSGVAELGSAAPVPANGRFRIGSVTKAFVATAVLQLVAEHRLGLDDPVAGVLPRVLPYADHVTIRQLLNHTSGVPEYLTTLPSPRSAAFLQLRWRTWTDAELVARVADEPPLFQPGTEARYSNTNYLLLGMIIGRVTGNPYAAEIRDRIIQPLHLTSTSVPGTNPYIRGPHAHGYLPIGVNQLVDITELNPTIMGSAGEMISTTSDLNRFFAALLGGRLLPPPLLRQMRTTALGSKYGLGLITLPLSCGITAYGKNGDAPGYSTWSFDTSRKRITVSVTWGTGDPNDAVDVLVDKALCAGK